jgi:DNA-binding MarR family transcriptional regulator
MQVRGTVPVPSVSKVEVEGPPIEDVSAVADNFSTLTRSFIKARTQMLAAAAHDVEWSAHIVLKCLSNEGSLRSSAIAELIDSDPSTVSRQVAALVKDGLIERRADPVDGRASLLVLTEKATQVVRDHDDVRDQHYAKMLAAWSSSDLRRFAELLARFTEDFNKIKNDWLPERVELRPAPAEGKH